MNTTRKKTVCTCAKNPWGTGDFVAISAMRYAMGRRSYVVGMTVEWVRTNWPRFCRNTRIVMTRDLKEQIDDLEVRPGYLGMSCDEDDWRGLYEFMRREGVEDHHASEE